jgi:hypothetical protein
LCNSKLKFYYSGRYVCLNFVNVSVNYVIMLKAGRGRHRQLNIGESFFLVRGHTEATMAELEEDLVKGIN